jgi:hypothetical protein
MQTEEESPLLLRSPPKPQGPLAMVGLAAAIIGLAGLGWALTGELVLEAGGFALGAMAVGAVAWARLQAPEDTTTE